MDGDWVIFGLQAILGGLVGGFVAGLIVNLKVWHLEQQFRTLYNRMISPAGVAARENKDQRLQEALVFVATKMKEPGADKRAIIGEALANYPDVAISLGKAFSKNGIDFKNIGSQLGLQL
jgi:hypothetical protein